MNTINRSISITNICAITLLCSVLYCSEVGNKYYESTGPLALTAMKNAERIGIHFIDDGACYMRIYVKGGGMSVTPYNWKLEGENLILESAMIKGMNVNGRFQNGSIVLDITAKDSISLAIVKYNPSK